MNSINRSSYCKGLFERSKHLCNCQMRKRNKTVRGERQKEWRGRERGEREREREGEKKTEVERERMRFNELLLEKEGERDGVSRERNQIDR